MEKKVNELIEESCFANDRGEFPLVRKVLLLTYCNPSLTKSHYPQCTGCVILGLHWLLQVHVKMASGDCQKFIQRFPKGYQFMDNQKFTMFSSYFLF